MVKLFFALAFAFVCWRASFGMLGPLRVYRASGDGRALAIAGAWGMLCFGAAGTSLYLMVTA